MTGMYVELVGVAGAGKTTVARILMDEARALEVPIRTRDVVGKSFWFRVRIIYTIVMIIVSTPEVLSLYRVLVRQKYANTPYIRKTIRDLVTRMIIDTAVVRCLLSRSPEFLVNDEGLLGKLVSLSILADVTPPRLQSLVKKLLPKPVMLVYVKVPSLLALNRERARDVELPFFNGLTDDLKETFFDEAVDAYAELASTEILIMPRVDTLFIDNNGTYDNLIAEVRPVAERLHALISSDQNKGFSL